MAVPEFDGCERVEHLSSGPVTDTYRAVQRPLGRPVSIKALSKGLLATSPFATVLEREARAQGALAHEHVVALHQLVRQGDRLWLVLEWVDGPSVAEALARRRPLSIPLCLGIAHGIAAALAHAHERGVLHGDLSPEVVRFSSRGVVKVGGFGAASEAEGTVAPLLEDHRRYASPEQLLGEPLDARSDLFSLGVMLFEVLAGRRPFQGAEGRESSQRVRRDPTPGLDRPEAPRRLEELTLRLLSKAPADRPPSARHVLEELEACAGELGLRSLPRTICRELAALGFPMVVDEEPAEVKPVERRRGPPGAGELLRVLGVVAALLLGGGLVLEVWRAEPSGGAGPTGRRLELAPERAGALRVVAHPWAHVIVDGQRLETTPFARPIPLAPGPHLVRLEHPQAPHELREIVIAPGETLLLDVTLRVEAPPLEDAAAPAEADGAVGSP